MRIRQSQARRDGATAVELAVLAPFLCFMFVIAVDFARVYYYSLALEQAARNGAYFASDYPSFQTTDNSYANVQQVVQAELQNLSPRAQVDVAYSTAVNGPYNTPTIIANGYVQVTVTWTFNSITQFPGVPNQTNLVKTCRMHVAPVVPFF